jgi:hypothetical protein
MEKKIVMVAVIVVAEELRAEVAGAGRKRSELAARIQMQRWRHQVGISVWSRPISSTRVWMMAVG